jgi:RES domain-containing protein
VASIGGVWWRHLPHGGEPLRHADPPADGRWQRGGVVGALYFASEEETAWAEWYRGLAERGLPPEIGLPRDLWRYEVQLEDVVDLSSDSALQEHGLASPRPTQRQWPAFQRVGEGLWEAGAQAILYESAAHPGHLALCVFVATESLGGLRPIAPAQVFEHPPPLPPRTQR